MVSEHRSVGTRRIRAVQQALGEQGLAALFVATGTNLLFLSGYPQVELTLARPFFLIVPRSGEPVMIVHVGREAEARRYSWVDDIRTYVPLSVAPIEQLEQAFADLGLIGGRIGAELGYEQRLGMPVLELERLIAAVGPTTFEDAAGLLWRLRMVKAPEDIDALRRACQTTSDAYERTFAETHPGDSDRDVVTRMRSAMADGAGGSPWVLIASGEGNYELATGVAVDRQLEPGDMVWLDSGCAVEGFWSDFSRAGVVGGALPEQIEAQQLIWEATEAGVRLVRPGVPVAEIAAASNDRLHALGLPAIAYTSDLAGRIGHGIGYDPTEPPHVSETDPTVLEAGMVISVEPGVATTYGLFHVEQNVLVTPTGYEILSTAPGHLRAIQ